MPARLPLSEAARRRLGLALGASVLAAVVARLPVRDPQGGQAHLALAAELAACVGASVTALAAARAGAPLGADRIGRLALALLAIEGASAALATNGWASLRASALVLAGAATFAAARAVGGVGHGPTVVALVVAASVILEALGVLPGLSRGGHAPGGVLGERNAASELLVCAAPAVAAAAVCGERAGGRLLASAAIGASVAAVVLTRTRSAWLALAALAAVGLGLSLRTGDGARRERAAAVVVAAALGLALALRAPTRLAWSSADPYRDTLARLVDRTSGSGAGRLAQLTTTLEMARAHPLLGVGPGNWAGQYVAFARQGDPTVREGFSPTTRLPSSDLAGFVAERGLIAALLALALAAALARGGDERRWVRRATLLAVLIVGTLDAALQLAPHLLLVAWTLGAASPFEPAAATPPRRSALIQGALAAALLACALLAAARVRAFSLAIAPRSLDDIERAAGLDPGNVPLRLRAAETFIEAGDCARARPHLDDAARLAAPVPAAQGLADRCR